jgi:hypothetical protein
VLGDVGLHTPPVVLIVTDALTVRTNRQQPLELFDVGERVFETAHPIGQRLLQLDHAHADADPRKQLVFLRRLGDIVVSARIEARDDVGRRITRREQHNIGRRRGVERAETAADLRTVEPRHHPIHHRQRGCCRGL